MYQKTGLLRKYITNGRLNYQFHPELPSGISTMKKTGLLTQNGGPDEKRQGDAGESGEPLPPHPGKDDDEGQEERHEHDVESERAHVRCHRGPKVGSCHEKKFPFLL